MFLSTHAIPSPMFNFSGVLPESVRIFCWVHTLNVDTLYHPLIYCSNVGMFSSMGAHGNVAGDFGGNFMVRY